MVLAYRMPDLTGEDVLRAIRVHPHLAGLPIVLCSADGPRDLPADLRAMVSAVIDKPFTIEEVAAAGRAIEPRATAAESTV